MRRDGSNILITLDDWRGAGLSFFSYENDKRAGYLQTANRACYGQGVEIIWRSIVKESRKEALTKYFGGNPERLCVVSELERHIREDAAAKAFFTDYELPDGQTLGGKNYKKVIEYYNNAIVLHAAGAMYHSIRAQHKSKGNAIGSIWPVIAKEVNELNREKYPHMLPAVERRLRERYKAYREQGLASLVHKSYGNIFSRKVDERLERLILSIFCMGNKPYSKWVHEYYLRFIAGTLDIVDMQTGVLFDRSEFYDEKKGAYIIICEATCWNYINNPKNRAIVDALRSTPHLYNSVVRPHYHRHAPKYSLSKISLDDRDLPRRMHDGNRVKAYYAYDVASGALIGVAYSEKKNADLYIECLRNMFRFLDARGYGMPMEAEVEHHIVSRFEADLMKAGMLFPFVRWCAPTNSQEKHAEQFNRQKKYGFEKRHQDGIGRWYAKLEANQTGGERVYEEETNKYLIKEKTYSFEQLVADDLASIEAYNNGLHRDQKKYPGKTRMDVLREHINPNLVQINKAVLTRYIGDCTVTSIQRNMYCQVQYRKYMLPSPALLRRLAPNNYTVHAYWLPSEAGIDRVFIYQNDEFIAECHQIETFTTAQAEWTDNDAAAMTGQAKYIAQFDKIVKAGKQGLAKPKMIENIAKYEAIEAVEAVSQANEEDETDLVPVYNDEEWQKATAIEKF